MNEYNKYDEDNGREMFATNTIAEITDQTCPEARAARLRRLRNLANLNRYEMCDGEDLNINTYKGWEIARYGGLPSSAAEKVIKRLSKAGVICPKEWLLSGTGHEPYVLPRAGALKLGQLNDEHRILKEITAFVSHYNETVYVKIADDAMLPYYALGDYVAGIREYGTNIDKLLHTNCIVLTDTGELLVRYLRRGSHKELHSLFHSNFQTILDKPVIYDVRIEYAARVARHYVA